MSRRLIAALWIAGATIPVVASTIFLIGCCVLPFHGVMHKLMPLCGMAAIAGDAGAEGDRGDQPKVPAREKQDSVSQLVAEISKSIRSEVWLTDSSIQRSPRSETGYRSYVSLGALRCDQDVGLNVLVETFLI